MEDKIIALLEAKFKEPEFSDFFVVEVKKHDHQKLDVFVDSDSGVPLSKCQQLSRYLESYIDEEKWMGEKYVLEVSSPGLSRPLTLPRQFRKNIGRKLAIQYFEGEEKKKSEGQLVDANDTACFLEEKVVRKEGKKKIRTTEVTEIPYESIKKAVIKPVFK